MLKPTLKHNALYAIAIASSLVLSGCSNLLSGLQPKIESSIDPATEQPNIATQYQPPATQVQSRQPQLETSTTAQPRDGLGQTHNSALNLAISQALRQNHGIKEQWALHQQALQQYTINNAELRFNLNLEAASSYGSSSQSSRASSDYDLKLKANLPVSLWGELDQLAQASSYQLAISTAALKRSRQQLVADITSAWYQLMFAEKVFELTAQQQHNTQLQLDAIESSYQQGLSQSLDVYLARGNIDTASTRTLEKQQSLYQASRELELLLAKYPRGRLLVDQQFPSLVDNYSLGVPADLLQRRPDLNSHWLGVLVEDAKVAASYAQQFPQFSLTGNLSLSSARLSDLFKQNIAWSLLGSLSQSLFDNGKAEALHLQSKAKLIEKEQQYLRALQAAFAEVETLLESKNSLKLQWQLNQKVLDNAQLSYERVQMQYQNGIANYQQVLNLQQKLFDNQLASLQLKQQRVDNQIELILAIGGSELAVAENSSGTDTE